MSKRATQGPFEQAAKAARTSAEAGPVPFAVERVAPAADDEKLAAIKSSLRVRDDLRAHVDRDVVIVLITEMERMHFISDYAAPLQTLRDVVRAGAPVTSVNVKYFISQYPAMNPALSFMICSILYKYSPIARDLLAQYKLDSIVENADFQYLHRREAFFSTKTVPEEISVRPLSRETQRRIGALTVNADLGEDGDYVLAMLRLMLSADDRASLHGLLTLVRAGCSVTESCMRILPEVIKEVPAFTRFAIFSIVRIFSPFAREYIRTDRILSLYMRHVSNDWSAFEWMFAVANMIEAHHTFVYLHDA